MENSHDVIPCACVTFQSHTSENYIRINGMFDLTEDFHDKQYSHIHENY